MNSNLLIMIFPMMRFFFYLIINNRIKKEDITKYSRGLRNEKI